SDTPKEHTMTNQENIAAILTDLGFEVADSPEFVADVARLAGAWDRNGLIFRIIGGATYGEAAETADAILEAIAPAHADLSKAQERYMAALAGLKAELIARGDERRHHEVEGLEALFAACFDGVAPHDAVSAYLKALDSTKAEAEARGDAQQHRDLEVAEAIFREIFDIAEEEAGK